MTKRRTLADLEARLGHVFANKTLLQRALTHVSAPKAERQTSYQRLEFLGDRVLGLVIAEMLYTAFPEASEGDLSVRLARLVCRETCAQIAQTLDVGAYVLMGAGEVRSKGREKVAVLGDVCEALIGAIFLDADFLTARAFVQRQWEPRMHADLRPIQDAKTVLQEWAQARGLGTPHYEQAACSGPAHAPVFVMDVCVEGFASGRGEGSSKRVAEQAAAQNFLDREAE